MNIDKNTLEVIKENLKILSDRKYQQELWLCKNNHAVTGFDETICQLFDDTGLDELLESGITVFNNQIDSLLRKISQEIDKIDDDLNVEEILELENWDKIIKLSRDALIMIEDERK